MCNPVQTLAIDERSPVSDRDEIKAHIAGEEGLEMVISLFFFSDVEVKLRWINSS